MFPTKKNCFKPILHLFFADAASLNVSFPENASMPMNTKFIKGIKISNPSHLFLPVFAGLYWIKNQAPLVKAIPVAP